MAQSKWFNNLFPFCRMSPRADFLTRLRKRQAEEHMKPNKPPKEQHPEKLYVTKELWDDIQFCLEDPDTTGDVALGKVLDLHPDVLQKRNSKEETFLYFAIVRQLRERKVATLIERCPASVKMHVENRLPYHIALTIDRPDEAVLGVLLRAHPKSAQIQDADERMAMHIALEHRPFQAGLANHLEEIIKVFPGCVEIPHGLNYPLHMALENDALPPHLTADLINRFPEAVKMKGDKGHWPLHTALMHDADPEVVSLLLEKSPHSVLQPMPDGLLPLQYAIQMNVAAEVIVSLAECDTGENSLSEANAHKVLTLALGHEVGPHLIKTILHKHPSIAWTPDTLGRYPLQIALQHGAHFHCVHAVLKAYPEAAQLGQTCGLLPLNIALAQQLSEEVTFDILKAHEGAVFTKCKDGRLPLHHALWHRASFEIVKTILDLNPSALQVQGNERRSPLYVALENRAKPDIANLLISEDPNTVSVVGPFGRLPLHCAALNNADVRVLQQLIQVNDKALLAKDNDGRTPIHCAAGRKPPIENIRMLLDPYPEVLRQQDASGKFPMQIAVSKGASAEVVKEFLYFDKRAVWVRDGRGRLPLFQAIDAEASAEVVQVLMDAAPEQKKELTPLEWIRRHAAVPSSGIAKALEMLNEAKGDSSSQPGQTSSGFHKALLGTLRPAIDTP